MKIGQSVTRLMIRVCVSAVGICGLVSVLSSCGNEITETRPSKPIPPEQAPDFAFTSEFPDVLRFEQGIPSFYQIGKGLRVNGVPELELSEMPAGASFDGTVFSWTPPCDLPRTFFDDQFGFHTMIATLRKQGDKQQFIQQRVVLIVRQFRAYPGRVCGQDL